MNNKKRNDYFEIQKKQLTKEKNMGLINDLTVADAAKTRKIVVLGKHGVGKTSLVKNFTNDEIIILDYENGLLPLAGLGYQSVAPTVQQTREYIKEIERGGANITGKTIVFDSISELSSMILKEAKQRCPKNTLQAYGQMIDDTSEMFRDLMKQNHCNVVLLGAVEQKIINDNDGQIEIERPMIDTSRVAGRLNFAFDGVFCLVDAKGDRKIYTAGTLSGGGLRCKDRSGKLDRIEEPNLKKILMKMGSMDTKHEAA